MVNSEAYTESSIVPYASYSGTQHYYYSGSSTESLYINATWSYGDGYYRYNQTLNEIGATYTEWAIRIMHHTKIHIHL